jgi:DNA-binding transcriptional regulator YiaG
MSSVCGKGSAVLVDVLMTPTQCRAARAMLQWSQAALASRAGVSPMTVRNFEGEITAPMRATLAMMRQTIEAEGVEFVGDHGVHLNPNRPKGRRK